MTRAAVDAPCRGRDCRVDGGSPPSCSGRVRSVGDALEHLGRQRSGTARQGTSIFPPWRTSLRAGNPGLGNCRRPRNAARTRLSLVSAPSAVSWVLGAAMPSFKRTPGSNATVATRTTRADSLVARRTAGFPLTAATGSCRSSSASNVTMASITVATAPAAPAISDRPRTLPRSSGSPRRSCTAGRSTC